VNKTERILEQGKALVRVVEALETIEPIGSIDRTMVVLLLQTYRHRLRAIVSSAPSWVREEILSASQEIDDQRPAAWMSENQVRREASRSPTTHVREGRTDGLLL
jgi:hypothetical protein